MEKYLAQDAIKRLRKWKAIQIVKENISTLNDNGVRTHYGEITFKFKPTKHYITYDDMNHIFSVLGAEEVQVKSDEHNEIWEVAFF